MATLYNVEPQPTAKLLLKTSAGDLVLELFAKQAPLASRNFLQHCLDGYYDGTIFHRLVPGFIIQGGDPTGLGTGGQSIYDNGAPFADEFHNRLRFNRRGLLGMANTAKDDNTSQFFLTLDTTPELQGKNTMFGRVEGDTIYNLMKLGEAELADEGGDRPLYPSKVFRAEILVNPFEDMVKRNKVESGTFADKDMTKKKRKATKVALSFGDEEEAPVIKRAKVNPNFGPAAISKDAARKEERPAERKQRNRASSSPPPRRAPPPPPARKEPAAAQPQPSPESEPEQVQKTMSALERTNAQIAALKQSMKRNTTTEAKPATTKKSALEAMIPATSTRGRKRGRAADGDGALDLFNAFKRKLGSTAPAAEPVAKPDPDGKPSHAPAAPAADEEERLCDLHFIANCQSCTAWDDGAARDSDDDDDDGDGGDWMSHQLSFAKDALGKDLEWKRKMDEFEVIDPRDKARDLAADKKRDKGRRDGAGNRARIDRR